MPFLMHCPEVIRGGSVVKKVVANIDVGRRCSKRQPVHPGKMDGRSFWQLVGGTTFQRDYVLYEYFGSATTRTRQPRMRFAVNASSTFATMVCGIRTNCTIFKTTRMRRPT